MSQLPMERSPHRTSPARPTRGRRTPGGSGRYRILGPILAAVLLQFTHLLPTEIQLVQAAVPFPPQLFDSQVASKVVAVAAGFQDPTQFPQYTYNHNLTWEYFPPTTWTSSFFSSTLYLLHVRHNILCSSGSSYSDFLRLAQVWSNELYPTVTALTNTHDVGFLSLPFQLESEVEAASSEGNVWPAIGGGGVGGSNVGKGKNLTSEAATLQMAANLAGRFNPIVGCTKSWEQGDFEVIIDNMMNIQLLWDGWLLTGNKTWFNMATSHADKTMANQVRPDGSTWHVVNYDPQTGAVISKMTAQGLNDNSTWSRGQSWGMYGFAMAYNYTGNRTYLDTSRRMAQYYLDHLPPGGVPYWDFDAPSGSPLDTSSATIASSAMLLLSTLESSLTPPNTTGSSHWQDSALNLLTNTVNLGWSGDSGSESILLNGTVNERDTPPLDGRGIVYGDYYFVESGNRVLKMGIAGCDVLPVSALPGSGSGAGGSGSGSGNGGGSNQKVPSGAPGRVGGGGGDGGLVVAVIAFAAVVTGLVVLF